VRRVKRDPLPIEAIVHYVDHPPADHSEFKRALVAAVLAVGLRCIRRAGELCDLGEDHLVYLGHGKAKILIEYSKTDSAGDHAFEVPFERGQTRADPVSCLDRYLRVAKGCCLYDWSLRQDWQPTAGRPLFTLESGAMLTPRHISAFVKEVARHAGFDGVFTCYSLRIGGACAAIKAGLSLEQLMAIGGWRASSSVAAYSRAMIGVETAVTKRMGL